ncbi:MAG: hypothetical protein IPQ13_13810 [Holophagaceae bacterium]|nr:hypothetical protein [Holophagaceae bacterium]
MKFSSMIFFLICVPLPSRQVHVVPALREIVLSKDEQEVYEVLFQKYSYLEKVVVCPNLTFCWGLDGHEGPEGYWKFFCSSDSLRSDGVVIAQYRKAFENIVIKSKQSGRIRQWNQKIQIRNTDICVESPEFTTISFSPIGFDIKNGLAIVFAEGSDSLRGGSGSYYFLKKIGGHWHIESSMLAWIT